MTRERLFQLERRLIGKHPTWMFVDNEKLVLVVCYPVRGFVFYTETGGWWPVAKRFLSVLKTCSEFLGKWWIH